VLGGLVAAFVVTNADEFEDLAECLEEADDEAARDACEEEFDERIGAPAPVRPAAEGPQSSRRRAETNASWGTSTRPMFFIFFLPSFCFSRSLRLRVMSPP
jgi:hypothetical protein